ncbi:MAG: thymidine kinase [Ureaplasma sp.]|nr:thymidine kinase [Ureaplasma sp.]
MNKLFQSEWIEVICGPMFSGKTEELLRKLNRLYWAKVPFITFKPAIDTRGGTDNINSRDGRKWVTNPIKSSLDIFEILSKPENKKIKVVAFDEAQFLDNGIIDVVKTLAKNGYHVIIACLDKDWRAKPFGPVPELLAIADQITKLSAICTICTKEATFTERVTNTNKDLIFIGDSDSYDARCRIHHHSFKDIDSESDQLYKKFLK